MFPDSPIPIPTIFGEPSIAITLAVSSNFITTRHAFDFLPTKIQLFQADLSLFSSSLSLLLLLIWFLPKFLCVRLFLSVNSMETLVSKIDGIELGPPEGCRFEATLLQVLGIAESSGLWRWGALLLAVAATLASIIATRRLAGFPAQTIAAGVEPCRSSGDASTLSSAVSFSSHCQPEEEKEEEYKANTPNVAVSRRIRTPDSDGKTKGKMWLKEEEQLESLGAETWDLSNGEVVKSWSQNLFAGDSSRTIIRRLPRERPMPVVAVSRTGGTAVWDPRASFQAPMIASHPHRRPASEMDFDGMREILVSYGGRRDNVSIPDLRMLRSNFDAEVMPLPNFGRLIWEDDGVIVTHENGNEFKEDELMRSGSVDFDYSLWNKSPKGMDSKSLVFWFLNSVRSISSGLKD